MLETARRFPGAVRELFLSQLGLCSAAFPHSGVSERVVSCLFPSSEATRCPSPASGTWVCSLLGNSFQINRQELSYFILVSQIGGGARWLNQCLHSVSPRVALLLNSTGKLFLEWDDGIGIIICWRKWKNKQTNKKKPNTSWYTNSSFQSTLLVKGLVFVVTSSTAFSVKHTRAAEDFRKGNKKTCGSFKKKKPHTKQTNKQKNQKPNPSCLRKRYRKQVHVKI